MVGSLSRQPHREGTPAQTAGSRRQVQRRPAQRAAARRQIDIQKHATGLPAPSCAAGATIRVELRPLMLDGRQPLAAAAGRIRAALVSCGCGRRSVTGCTLHSTTDDRLPGVHAAALGCGRWHRRAVMLDCSSRSSSDRYTQVANACMPLAGSHLARAVHWCCLRVNRQWWLTKQARRQVCVDRAREKQSKPACRAPQIYWRQYPQLFCRPTPVKFAKAWLNFRRGFRGRR